MQNKYFVFKVGYSMLLLKLKEILVNEKVAMIPGDDDDDHQNLYFMAKFIPEKIISTIAFDDYNYFKEDSKWSKFVYLNEQTGFFIEDNTLYLRKFFIDNQNNPIEEKDVYSIEGFVDKERNAPWLMEFESDECAQLWAEASKIDWENNYGKSRYHY